MKNVLPVAAVLLLLLAGWAAIKSIARPSASEAAMLQSLDRLADGQAQLLARLEKLESVSGGRRTARPVSAGRGAGNQFSAQDQSGVQNQVPSAQQARGNEILTHESRFVAETLTPAWATRNEGRINAFLSKANLSRMKTTAPSRVSSRCHSPICRISMVFEVDDFPDGTLLNLYQSIADELPDAAIFHVPRPDGSVEVLVFAHGPAPAPR